MRRRQRETEIVKGSVVKEKDEEVNLHAGEERNLYFAEGCESVLVHPKGEGI